MKIETAVAKQTAPLLRATDGKNNKELTESHAPAYIVEISGAKPAKDVRLTPTQTDRNKLLENLQKPGFDVVKAASPDDDTPLVTLYGNDLDALDILNGDTEIMLHMMGQKIDYAQGFKLDGDVVARQEKFFQADKRIEQGGAKTFLEYSRMFAGMADYAAEELTDARVEKWRKAGQWSEEQDASYQRAKSYGNELQQKSGVLVGVDFMYASPKNLGLANSIETAYFGSEALVGVHLLDFMAQHKDGEDIWVNAVQGAYQDKDSFYAAMKGIGHEDWAQELEDSIQQARQSFWEGKSMPLDESVGTFNYGSNAGNMWRTTIGEERYNEFVERFQLQDTKVRYTKQELHKITEEAKQDYADLKANPYDKTERNDNQRETLDYNKKDNAAERIAELRDKIKRVREHMSDLRKGAVLDEKLKKKLETYQKQIETYQRQISDIQIEQAKQQQVQI